MAERFFVRNTSGVKVHLPLETSGRVIVAPGDQLEYSTKAAAESAAHDYNSALAGGSPVQVVVEEDIVVPKETAKPTKKASTPDLENA